MIIVLSRSRYTPTHPDLFESKYSRKLHPDGAKPGRANAPYTRCTHPPNRPHKKVKTIWKEIAEERNPNEDVPQASSCFESCPRSWAQSRLFDYAANCRACSSPGRWLHSWMHHEGDRKRQRGTGDTATKRRRTSSVRSAACLVSAVWIIDHEK